MEENIGYALAVASVFFHHVHANLKYIGVKTQLSLKDISSN